MKRFLLLLAIFVLPVWLFDGCANRDPNYYLDESSRLIAPWSTAPLTLEIQVRSGSGSERVQLPDISEFRMAEPVFTGKTGEDFFLVSRPEGEVVRFATEENRDAALRRDFAITPEALHPKPWYSGIRANLFFPYHLIYYACATGMIAFLCFSRHRKRPNPEREG